MTTLREAAQQALEALENMLNGADAAVSAKAVGPHWWHHGRAKSRLAITTLRAALEQPEQCDRCGKVTRYGDVHTCTPRILTDEVIADLWHQNGTYHHHFARAIERWLKGEE